MLDFVIDRADGDASREAAWDRGIIRFLILTHFRERTKNRCLCADVAYLDVPNPPAQNRHTADLRESVLCNVPHGLPSLQTEWCEDHARRTLSPKVSSAPHTVCPIECDGLRGGPFIAESAKTNSENK